MHTTGHNRLYGDEEIDRLYDELDDSDCECVGVHAVAEPCNFHKKVARLTYLHNEEIEMIESGFRQLRASIGKTLPVLEEIDARFYNVLK